MIIGAARSGKSRHAEASVRAIGGQPIYVATARAYDDEMRARIVHHRTQRGAGWRTVEEPIDLVGALDRSDGQGPRLVECLTLWLSNLLLDGRDWCGPADALLDALDRQRSPVVLVANEVGWDPVPDNALARAFVDAQGAVAQRIAARAETVVYVVAGVALPVKGPTAATPA
nr:bifunctional adenosylcobinamide kinase/adenosylcobinamide-phosphate guanylyltransferase [Rhodothalassium salexigens]